MLSSVLLMVLMGILVQPIMIMFVFVISFMCGLRLQHMFIVVLYTSLFIMIVRIVLDIRIIRHIRIVRVTHITQNIRISRAIIMNTIMQVI